MKAIVLRKTGGPEVLQLEDWPLPQPASNQVLVKLKAAALNRRDLLARTRPAYAEMMPFIPGSDGAGVVAAVGDMVTRFAAGEAVIVYPSLRWGPNQSHPGADFEILGGPSDGTYAEYICLPQENFYPLPAGYTMEQAACLGLVGLTAWRALITQARLLPGERVYIPGAGSGVASVAIQIARLAGARVFVSSHSDEKIARAIDLGAEGGVNYTRPGWQAALHSLSGGVDIVLDSAGAASLPASLDLLLPGGRLVTIGSTSGSAIELELRSLYSKQVRLIGSTMGSPQEFEAFLRLAQGGKIKAVIDRAFPLAEAAAAHAHMEAQEQFGKILLLPE